MQRDGRIRAAMNEVADRVRLDRRLRQTPPGPESGQEGRLVHLGRVLLEMRLEQAEPTFIRPGGPHEAGGREMGRGYSGHGGPRRVQSFRPCSLFEEDLDARGRARGNSLGRDQLVDVQSKQFSGDEAGAEMRHDAGRVETGVMKAPGHRGADPDCRLHSGNIGDEQGSSVEVQVLTERQRARQAGGRRVNDADKMGIVEIEPVNQNAIRQGRVAHGKTLRTADDAARAGTSQRLNAGHRFRRELLDARRQRDAQRVEDQELGALQDLGGDVIQGEASGE